LKTQSQIARDQIILTLSIILGAAVLLFASLWATGVIAAEKATTECENIGEPCKIVRITPQEEQLLIRQGGVLDTASAGRYIELGNVTSYFRMKLMQAPQGEMKLPPPLPEPPKAEIKPAEHPVQPTEDKP
jgi:hypothetical protein